MGLLVLLLLLAAVVCFGVAAAKSSVRWVALGLLCFALSAFFPALAAY